MNAPEYGDSVARILLLEKTDRGKPNTKENP